MSFRRPESDHRLSNLSSETVEGPQSSVRPLSNEDGTGCWVVCAGGRLVEGLKSMSEPVLALTFLKGDGDMRE